MCSSPQHKGFTLVELVLVTMIILVLAGLSTPLFRGPFRNIQLKNTCGKVQQLIRYLRARSIAERTICRMNFDFEQGLIWPTEEDETAAGEFKRIKKSWARTYQIAEGISIQGETNFITFYPDGKTEQVQITLSDSQGKTYTLTTQKGMGFVKIEQEE